ncbi:hypothetical protein [Rugamonas aquatica]|uniref:Uncharacterized protein n=1 Tax=Rugamonas aquatica TaxID=2743357 RepID=A0A6A7MUF3_9BURK|nr:hypothetical protein [Rugamonas aquatica]MQA36756.1 hypothetical protein [Rugamonas aquatica]
MKVMFLARISFLLATCQMHYASVAADFGEKDIGSLSVAAANIGAQHVPNNEIIDLYKNSELEDIPATVSITAAQKKYILDLFNSMLDIIDKKRDLKENDAIFGKGDFFWPKDPKKPIKARISYDVGNFKFRSISIGFSRVNSSSPWNSAGISVHPRNFPLGFFEMKISRSFFERFLLEKAITEKRQHEALEIVNVFWYTGQENGRKFRLQFEASPTVSSIKDGYPRSFHNAVIYLEEN